MNSTTNKDNNTNNENENANGRKDSFNNEIHNVDYFKILISFFTLSSKEIGKIDTSRTTFISKQSD